MQLFLIFYLALLSFSIYSQEKVLLPVKTRIHLVERWEGRSISKWPTKSVLQGDRIHSLDCQSSFSGNYPEIQNSPEIH